MLLDDGYLHGRKNLTLCFCLCHNVANNLHVMKRMALRIQNSETEHLARMVSKLTGETIPQTVKVALTERLERLQKERLPNNPRIKELNEIALHCASLPVLDDRSADEILDYDEYGLPR